MARICVKPVCDWMIASKVPLSPTRKPSRRPKFYACSPHSTIRSSQNTDDTDKFYKELGMFSLRKKINDTVLRAESLTPEALELEEASRIEQEEAVRNSDLWDDLAKSSEVLMKLASRSNVVDALKDLRYKAEEAKLITQLAEMDAINYGLFKQAYSASVDVSKFLDTYETSKLLRGPFDAEGACMIIRAGTSAYYPEMWVKQLLRMYTKWSHKQGLQARAAEMCFSEKGGIRSAILELESKYMYGYLSGERGVHSMISNSANSSISSEVIAASVDVIPLFLDATPDLQIDDNDLLISSPSSSDTEAGSSVCVQHIPTSLRVESSGERSRFANKIKAVNRLKAKLLVILRDQGVSSLRSIEKGSMTDIWHQQQISILDRHAVLSKCLTLPPAESARIAEALACREALKLVSSFTASSVVVAGDALSVLDSISAAREGRGKREEGGMKEVMEEIVSVSARWESLILSFCGRNGCHVAHYLATHVARSDGDKVWFEILPEWLVRKVEKAPVRDFCPR